MKRKMMSKLLKWKVETLRKPLLLKGVRQVGKTHLLKEFGKTHFPKYHYFNFEKDPSLAKIFEPDLLPERILNATTPLEIANVEPVECTSCEMLHYLIKLSRKYNLDLDLNTKESRYGLTPLHIAAKLRRLDFVLALLRAGADITITNDEGLTPVDVAHEDIKQDLQTFLGLSSRNRFNVAHIVPRVRRGV